MTDDGTLNTTKTSMQDLVNLLVVSHCYIYLHVANSFTGQNFRINAKFSMVLKIYLLGLLVLKRDYNLTINK